MEREWRERGNHSNDNNTGNGGGAYGDRVFVNPTIQILTMFHLMSTQESLTDTIASQGRPLTRTSWSAAGQWGKMVAVGC